MIRLSEDTRKKLLGDASVSKTSTEYQGDLSDPSYYTGWFEDDIEELMNGGYAKTVEEAITISEKNIRSLFESALKQGKLKALAKLKK